MNEPAPHRVRPSDRPGPAPRLHRRPRSAASGLVLLLLLFAVSLPAIAQSDEAEESRAARPAEAPAADATADLSEEERARLAELEAQLQKARAVAREWASRASSFQQARDEAPQRLQAIEADLAALEADPPPIPAETTAVELEARLLDAEQDLALERKAVQLLEAELANRADRRRRLPELLAGAKERLRRLRDEPAPPNGTPPVLYEKRQELSAARTAALDREIETYQVELASFDTRGQLTRKELDRAARRVVWQEEHIENLREALQERTRQEALRSAEISRQIALEAESMPPAVKDLARELAQQNQALAEERAGDKGLASKIDSVRQKLARADARVAQLEADYERLVEKVEAAGLSDSVGLMLRKQRSETPDMGKYRRFIRMRQELISSVQLEQIERREQRQQLSNIDALVEKAMAKLDPSVGPEDRARIESLLVDLLETKRAYLDSLIEDYEIYFQKLIDFDARQQELIRRTEALLQFIDERVLWIPSGEAVHPALISEAWSAIEWLMAPRFVDQLVRALGDVLARAPLLTAVVALAFVAFGALRRRLVDRFTRLGTQAQDPKSARIMLSLEACGLTLLLAGAGPALLAYVSWQLAVSPDATQYVRCVAHGASSAALLWLSLEVPRQLLRKNGLVAAHFGAPVAACRTLRRRLGILAAFAVPAVFLIQTLELRAEDSWRESLGRIAFVAVMTAATVLLHTVLRDRGAFWAIAEQKSVPAIRGWVRALAHLGATAAPLLLAAGALRGYYWTATKLAGSFHLTLVFLFLLFVAFRLGVLWASLARRRLAVERLAAAPTSPLPEGEAGGIELEAEVDLQTVDAQTSRLLKSAAVVAFVLGLWFIWVDLLPAMGILREVELWRSTRSVLVETTNASGEISSFLEDRIQPVTLSDLLFAVILAAMSMAVVRNLPGFLEITIFHRLAPGERYAYATLAKYAIGLVGIVLVFNAVGVGWSNIQWLVAAVGLGLGFGLQEIFANFVSGLIILFERPIRVGDTVTVGNVSGVVSRIRIRATWITAFDRKELVVPNKEFVTNQLVNWSLSDPVSRIEIKVGIAYGSDTEKAIELLHRVAEENPDVLSEPKPVVIFTGFGESSLDFELRAFSPNIEKRLPIVHALHLAIDRAFREEGIEIAFPQRDLHLRSTPAREGRGEGEGEGEGG